jgi:hypothetical protein
MLNLIEDNIIELQSLCEQYDVKTMYVFGSPLARINLKIQATLRY